MILAVLEARCGLHYSGKDVYLNVVGGGLRICEPAADLPVATALVSCLKNRPLPTGYVAFGEIGLSGEIRQVNQGEGRLKEACKLGFSHGLVPVSSLTSFPNGTFTCVSLTHIRDLVTFFLKGSIKD